MVQSKVYTVNHNFKQMFTTSLPFLAFVRTVHVELNIAEIFFPEFATIAPPRTAPFQLKIIYRTPDGGVYMRVLTQERPVTENRELAETEMNPAVIGWLIYIQIYSLANN